MSVQPMHKARDCETGSTDWTTIGTRILQAASMASAMHLVEQARGIGQRPVTETPAGSGERTNRLGDLGMG